MRSFTRISGRPRDIVDQLGAFEPLVDELATYSFPLTSRGLETLATVTEGLRVGSPADRPPAGADQGGWLARRRGPPVDDSDNDGS